MKNTIVTKVEFLSRETFRIPAENVGSRFDEKVVVVEHPISEIFEVKVTLANNGDTSKLTESELLNEIKNCLNKTL